MFILFHEVLHFFFNIVMKQFVDGMLYLSWALALWALLDLMIFHGAMAFAKAAEAFQELEVFSFRLGCRCLRFGDGCFNFVWLVSDLLHLVVGGLFNRSLQRHVQGSWYFPLTSRCLCIQSCIQLTWPLFLKWLIDLFRHIRHRRIIAHIWNSSISVWDLSLT